jgi:DNA-binding MarR family transcriptional regulator
MTAAVPPPNDYREIDDHIHGRVRLAIMAYLSGAGSADFKELREAAAATDGNLSANLRRLEEVGYVSIDKSFVDRRPLTRVNLTDAGREAWIAYLARMRAMLFPDQA